MKYPRDFTPEDDADPYDETDEAFDNENEYEEEYDPDDAWEDEDEDEDVPAITTEQFIRSLPADTQQKLQRAIIVRRNA